MIQQLYDILLHKLTKHTNLSVPYCRYISSDVFPEQDTELLNKYVTLRYRDHYIVDEFDDEPFSRPSDDTVFIPKSHDGPEFHGDPHDVYEDDFLVVRADMSEPYRLIAVSRDYTTILINSTRLDPVTGDYAFKHYISKYAVQDNKFFALDLMDQYAGEINELQAVSVRCDSSEPLYSVMVEFLGARYIRFVIGDEMFSILRDYYDFGETDYDNASAREEESYLDVDGYKASHVGLHDVVNIDGGSASNMWRLLKDRRAGQLEYFGPDEHIHELDPEAKVIIDFDMETINELVTVPENDGLFNFEDLDGADSNPANKVKDGDDYDFNAEDDILVRGDFDFGDLDEGVDPDSRVFPGDEYDFDEWYDDESPSIYDWNFGNIDPLADDDPESIPLIRESLWMDYEKSEDFYIVEPEKELTKYDRAAFLRRLMEGKIIYGTVQVGAAG